MRIIIFSDSHGNVNVLKKIIEQNISAEIFIHLGDGAREVSLIRQLYPFKEIYSVRGNCDISTDSNEKLVIDIDGKNKIFATHGHLYNVKYGLDSIKNAAKFSDANIIVYGHTHFKYNLYEDDFYILNPGSCSQPRDSMQPSYGFIDITNAGVFTNIVMI